jgi:hypothetical protein
MHILAKIKDGIVEDVIVTPEIPPTSDGIEFIDVTTHGAGPEIIGKTSEQVSTGRAWSVMIEEPIVQRQPVIEETVSVSDEVTPEVTPE